MADTETCLICGTAIPEGRQVCPNCNAQTEETEQYTPVSGATRDMLRSYLKRYINASKRKRVLENRLRRLRSEISCGGKALDGMPHSPTPGRTTEAVGIRLTEIGEQIVEQTMRCADIMSEIMGVFAMLPHDSMERNVLEMRYIDGMSWYKIGDVLHYSSKQVKRYGWSGLDCLLERLNVQAAVIAYDRAFK